MDGSTARMGELRNE